MPSRASHSYAFRGSEKLLIGKTIGDMFDEIAETYPDNDTVVSPHQGIRYTYRQLQCEVDTVAKGFVGLGLKKGYRLAMGHEHSRMGHHTIRHCEGRNNSSEYQPCVQNKRT